MKYEDFKDDIKTKDENVFSWSKLFDIFHIETDLENYISTTNEQPYRKYIYEIYCERGTTIQYSDDNFSLLVVSDIALTEKTAEVILFQELHGYHVVSVNPVEDLDLFSLDNVIYINNGN